MRRGTEGGKKESVLASLAKEINLVWGYIIWPLNFINKHTQSMRLRDSSKSDPNAPLLPFQSEPTSLINNCFNPSVTLQTIAQFAYGA